jgi:hypothetical protein
VVRKATVYAARARSFVSHIGFSASPPSFHVRAWHRRQGNSIQLPEKLHKSLVVAARGG